MKKAIITAAAATIAFGPLLMQQSVVNASPYPQCDGLPSIGAQNTCVNNILAGRSPGVPQPQAAPAPKPATPPAQQPASPQAEPVNNPAPASQPAATPAAVDVPPSQYPRSACYDAGGGDSQCGRLPEFASEPAGAPADAPAAASNVNLNPVVQSIDSALEPAPSGITAGPQVAQVGPNGGVMSESPTGVITEDLTGNQNAAPGAQSPQQPQQSQDQECPAGTMRHNAGEPCVSANAQAQQQGPCQGPTPNAPGTSTAVNAQGNCPAPAAIPAYNPDANNAANQALAQPAGDSLQAAPPAVGQTPLFPSTDSNPPASAPNLAGTHNSPVCNALGNCQ